MMRLNIHTAVLLYLVLLVCHADGQTSPVVSTQSGSVRGKTVTTGPGRGVNVFLGIPYAAPPTGSLRFAPPSPPTPWSSVKIATSHGSRCLEKVIPEDPVTPKVPASEDCLFLDVYSPWSDTDQDTDQLYSVMLYIHGGGFYGGTGALYNFTNVAVKDVVVVSINYRLDVFGFLSTGDDTIPGNYGLLDQAFALKWVKENIRSFKGNPDDITLFGGSAGAASISLLALSPMTRGTFQKAIMQSGNGLATWALRESHSKSLEIAQMMGQALSCDVTTPETLLSCIRLIPAHNLINASVTLQNTINASPWMPVLDKSFLPDTPLNILNKEPNVISIPTIRGYNKEDMSYYIPDPTNSGLSLPMFTGIVKMFMSGVYTENLDKLVMRVMQEYLMKDPSEAGPLELRSAAIEIATDLMMVVPAAAEAKLFSQRCSGQDSYLYEFAHRPSYSRYPPWMGVVHADEKGFVLGLPQGPDPFSYEGADETDRAVAELVVSLWTNLAKHGDPTPSALNNTVWQPYATGANCPGNAPVTRAGFGGKMYVIKEGPEVLPFDRADKVFFWEKTLPDLAKWLGEEDISSATAVRSSLLGVYLTVCALLTYLRDI